MLAVALVLEVFDHSFERLMVLALPFLNAHDHVAVHLQKSAI